MTIGLTRRINFDRRFDFVNNALSVFGIRPEKLFHIGLIFLPHVGQNMDVDRSINVKPAKRKNMLEIRVFHLIRTNLNDSEGRVRFAFFHRNFPNVSSKRCVQRSVVMMLTKSVPIRILGNIFNSGILLLKIKME